MDTYLFDDLVLPEYTAKEKADNAILWLSTLSKTAAKQQSAYLGGAAFGYNIFGVGCKKLDLPFFPDQVHSPHFFQAVGLRDCKGTFAMKLNYTHKEYGSLEELSRFLSFRRIATWMKHAARIRSIFDADVAEVLNQHFFGKRITRHKKAKEEKKTRTFINQVANG